MQENHGCSNPSERRDIASIWTRARVQAFAHQVAVERLEKKIKDLKVVEMRIAVSAIALLVVGFTLGLGLPHNAGVDDNPVLKFIFAVSSHAFLFLSTMLGVYGLYFVVTSERDKLIALQSQHKLSLRLFMNVSGKTRCIVVDIHDPGFYKFNIAFLHELIAALQTAGETPSDEDYAEAHRRHFAVLDFSRSEIPDSFAPDEFLSATERDARLCRRLAEHLRNQTDELVRMSLADIERITEGSLPGTASDAEWWRTPDDPGSIGHRAWVREGYDAFLVSQSVIEFRRRSSGPLLALAPTA
jgi:hypothetical protein